MDSNGTTRQTRRARRPAFTLVELLVVITIIGILMGFLTGAVIRARAAARRAAIQTEIDQLGTALKKYYDQFGDYPPDCTNSTKFIQHLQLAFPRFTSYISSGTTTPAQQFSSFQSLCKKSLGGIDPGTLDPSMAMVFFLGGRPVGNITGAPSALIPLSADPSDPFDINYLSNTSTRTYASLPPRMASFFDFDVTRLYPPPPAPGTATTTCYQYYPNIGTAAQMPAPYIYFRAMTNGINPNGGGVIPGYNATSAVAPNVIQRWMSPTEGTYVYPYYWASYTSNVKNWFRPKDFQIISAGLDGLFGTLFSAPLDNPSYTLGTAGAAGHVTYGYDNVTNFASAIENVR